MSELIYSIAVTAAVTYNAHMAWALIIIRKLGQYPALTHPYGNFLGALT